MAEKKYYWLKMTDQFFEDKAIKKLRKIAGGDTYTIIYLKMLLTAIKQGNKMYFEGIEDDFMEELALELDEDTDNVKVTGTCINYSVYISSFKGKYSGGLGDFYYDIKFIIAREIKIYTTKELKIGTSSKTQRPASKKSNKKSTTGSKTTTYTIKSGDTLSRIAQKKLGKASRYPEIYKLNKSKIEAAAKKHGRKSSNNGHWIYPGTKLTIPKK